MNRFLKYSLSVATVLATMMLASCSAIDPVEPVAPPVDPDDDGMIDVTFNITTDAALSRSSRFSRAFSRADGDIYAERPDANSPIKWVTDGVGGWQRLGRGSNVNKLIYEVYLQDEDENGNTVITRLTQYGNTNGQFIDYFDPDEDKVITLRLMRGKVYRLAFWAQCDECEAYTTNIALEEGDPDDKKVGLQDVVVSYDGAECSDDKRDAFCKVEVLSVSATTTIHDVILTRPFAQVNVATTGADIKELATGQSIIPNMEINQTAVRFTGVASHIDVVRDIIDDTDIKDVEAFFDWTNIPASLFSNPEEYLYIDLNRDGAYRKYTESYPTISEDGTTYLTEQFKYLAMNYILVPDTKLLTDENGNPVIDVTTGKPMFYDPRVKVEVFFKNPAGEPRGMLSVDEVYVRRNWRTNLLGGLSSGETGKSIIQSTVVRPSLDTDYEDGYVFTWGEE